MLDTERYDGAKPQKIYHTDKIEHGYHPVYAQLAHRLRMPGHPSPARSKWIVEIGTSNGGGLDYFNDLFAHNRHFGILAGVDQNKNSANPHGPMVHGDQEDPGLPFDLRRATSAWARDTTSSPTFWNAVAERVREVGPIWDVIIDDASHNSALTEATLTHMWPELRPGGVYVIEDWNHVAGLCYALAKRLVTEAFDFHQPSLRAWPASVERIEIHDGLILISKMS